MLELGGEAIGDSTRIIAALERLRPEPALYPSDPGERHRALEIEEFFDEEFGPQLRLLVIHHMLPDPRLLFGAFAPDLSAAGRGFARSTYPLVRRRITRLFEIDEGTVERAWAKCRAACERFAAELQPTGHLVGDAFTVADLTVAALCSPVVAPPEYPYPQPQRGRPEGCAELEAALW